MQPTNCLRKLALVLEYEGTNYNGFQLQANGRTIQGELETAILQLTKTPVRVQGASRTDAGAHAIGQVVSFVTSSHHCDTTIRDALNFYLPMDIQVKEVREVPRHFNPRHHATSRIYRYTILNSETPSPLLRKFVHWEPRKLDIDRMKKAARILPGTRDFSAFSRAIDASKSTIRRMDRWDIRKYNDQVVMETEANAFLPQQIRRIAGALIAIGIGTESIEAFRNLLTQSGRGDLKAEQPLPAHGLCLIGINYPTWYSHQKQKANEN